MSTGLERLTLVGWEVEPVERAPIRCAEAGGASFTGTTQGAVDFTTTISTALTVAADTAYVGKVLLCVAATNVANIGVAVRILAFTNGATTLTHTPFPARTEVDDRYIIFDTPEARCVVTTADAAAPIEVTAAARTEAVNFWKDDWLVCRAADNVPVGELRKVVTSSIVGVFTQSAGFSVATVLGDLFDLMRFPKWWGNPALDWTTEDMANPVVRASLDGDAPIKGCKTWSAECTLPLKGSGVIAGEAVIADVNEEIHRPLSAIMSVAQATGDTVVVHDGVGHDNSTTVFNLSTGTLANFPIGAMISDKNGNGAFVTASAANAAETDSITHSPPFPVASAAADVIYAGVGYQPMATGHKSMTLAAFIGGITHWTGFGGMPSLKIVDFGRNKVPKLVLSYQGGFWIEVPLATPAPLLPTFDTLRPIGAADCVAKWMIGSTVTEMILEDATIDYGHELILEDGFTLPEAIYGGRIVGVEPTITMTLKLDTAAPNNTFARLQQAAASVPFGMYLQHGRAFGNMVGWHANKLSLLAPKHAVADGLRKIQLTAKVIASDLTGLAMCQLGTV